MKGRKLFALVLAMMLLALTFTGCGGGSGEVEGEGDDGQKYELRLSTLVNDEHPLTLSAHRFADAVSAATDGNVTITVYSSSQLGDYTSVYDELMMGSIDLAWQTIPDTYDPRANIGMTPYIAMDWDDVEALYCDQESWYFKAFSEVNNAQGVTMLGIAPNGFMGVGAKSLGNLDTLFDLSSKQDALIRSSANDTLVAQVESFGFRVTTIPYADLYSSLQTGVADGWYGGSLVSNDVGFKDVIDYFVEYRGVNEPMGMLISTTTLESLPVEYQDIIVNAGKEETKNALEAAKTAEEEARASLEEYGITIITPTDEELAAVAEEVRANVYPMFAEDFGEELMGEIEAWVDTL